MTVRLHWAERLTTGLGHELGPQRYADYGSVAEALEQAVADDGLNPVWITNEAGDEVLCSKEQIAAYAKAHADLEAKRDAAIAKAHEAHAAALAAHASSPRG